MADAGERQLERRAAAGDWQAGILLQVGRKRRGEELLPVFEFWEAAWSVFIEGSIPIIVFEIKRTRRRRGGWTSNQMVWCDGTLISDSISGVSSVVACSELRRDSEQLQG